MSSESLPPEPWHSFLRDLDEACNLPRVWTASVGLLSRSLYGLDRPTADVDVIELAPREASETLMKIAMQGSALHRKHRIYLDRVGVAAIPENYEERLTEMFPGTFRHLRLMALDPYDISLSKLERNSQKDRDDVRYLSRTVPLDLATLQQRYDTELRWQLGRPDREDLTMKLWIEMLSE